MKFLILPNQLFDIKYLKNLKLDITEFICYEHPQYFKKFKYNKKKLILHRASLKYYFDHLKKLKYNVTYLDFNDKLSAGVYHLFDPIDKIALPKKHVIYDSPNFMLSNKLCEEYRKKTKNFFFNAFYMWSKKQLDILPSIKSQDKENRKTLPKGITIPKLPKIKQSQYISEAITYVKSNFNNNYGDLEDFNYPISREEAKKWLSHFIQKKFKVFGDYQDFIDEDESFLFHSILSSSINIGLINPSEIIEEIMKIKSKIPLNSFEGYVRQLFWREYQRYCYKYFDFDKLNYFGNKKKLNKKWYSGDLNIVPIDNCIKKGFKTGYLHHIERLMVMGNFMNLYELEPKEGYKWFMEFSCDSYEWVMKQNVLDMVFFVSGGKTMRRPYASSSNYVLKMSNYKKGEWCAEWDKLYHDFINRNEDKLYKYRYYFRSIKTKK